MSRYLYKARKADGSQVEDELEALSRKEALHQLSLKGLTPISLEDKGVLPDLSIFFTGLNRVKLRDLAVFFRQLSSIFSAGVPLFESLLAIEDQIGSGVLKKIVHTLLIDIEGGKTFSQALASHPRVFSRLVVTMVEAGERGGVLGDVLAKISQYLEKEGQLQQKIGGALRYPIMVLTALGLAFVFAIAFIIPKFNAIFSAFKTDLPLPTRILLGMNYVITQYWLTVILAGIGLYALFRFYLRQPWGKKQWDGMLLKAPVLGLVLTKLSLSRFFRMLSAMISSGIPLIYGLEVTANTADNAVIAEAIMNIRLQIMAGGVMSTAMRSSPIFPSTAYHMVAIGERSGNLEAMLLKTADYFDEETDYTVSNLTSLIEPLLILVLAGFVLLLALGIFLPMWSMMQLYS